MNVKKDYYDKIERHGGEPTALGRGLSKLNFFYQDKYEVCAQMAGAGDLRLLDIGCEDGQLLSIVYERFSELHGLDISSIPLKKAIQSAKTMSGNANVQFCQGDAERGLPYQDSVFDVVSCMSTLEHVFSPPDLLNEVHRVLRNRGLLVLEVPNIAYFLNRIKLLFGVLPRTTGGPLEREWEHLHIFTGSALNLTLESLGFTVKERACSGAFSKHRCLCPSLLGGNLILKCEKS